MSELVGRVDSESQWNPISQLFKFQKIQPVNLILTAFHLNVLQKQNEMSYIILQS